MAEYVERYTSHKLIGRRVIVYEQTDSTNDRCAAFAHDSECHGLVVFAREQTAGRGRHGRTWTAKNGECVLLSVLLFPPDDWNRPVILTAWAAVAVCDLVEQFTKTSPKIKWPNDVLVNGKKICGILMEQKRAVVAGIGLNVNQTGQRFEECYLPHGQSLFGLTGCEYDADDVAMTLIEKLDARYEHLTTHPNDLESAWCERLEILDAQVAITTASQKIVGQLVEASFDALVIYDDTGELHHITPEAVIDLKRR